MKRIMIAACVLVTVFGASADTKIRQKHHNDAFTVMGQTQPARDYEGTLWFGRDRARNDMDKQSIIMRMDKGIVIVLNHENKTWSELPMDMSKAISQATRESGEDVPEGLPAEMQEMMKGMFKNMRFSVTETAEKAVINGWNCRKYIQKVEGGMAPSTSEVWASTDVKLDYTMLAKMSASMMAMQPGLKEMVSDIQKETEKIKGMTVKSVTVSTVMNSKMKSSMELIEVKNDLTPPAGIYDPPAGYKKVKGMQ
ncbi:DUF4412 domain-containing protein [bacterium]|nr:DUF4412 domain-containing protein [bacterium]